MNSKENSIWGSFAMGLGMVFVGSGDVLEDLGRLWAALRRLGHILGCLGAFPTFCLACWKSLEIFLVRIAKDHACHSSLIQPLCPKSKRLDFLSILHVGRLRVDRLRADLEENIFSGILAEFKTKSQVIYVTHTHNSKEEGGDLALASSIFHSNRF